MKAIKVLFISILIIIPTSCRKATPVAYSYTGTLLGYSMFMNPCSAGYLMAVYNVPSSGDTTAYTFASLPAGCGINPASASVAAPIKVKLNWHLAADGCGVIIVDAIERE